MKLNQNDYEYLKDQIQQGKITAAEANVLKVEMQRVLIVCGSLPASVRKILNEAVKSGRLEHKKRDGYKPEVYYKSGFAYLANGERNHHAEMIAKSISGVCI